MIDDLPERYRGFELLDQLLPGIPESTKVYFLPYHYNKPLSPHILFLADFYSYLFTFNL